MNILLAIILSLPQSIASSAVDLELKTKNLKFAPLLLGASFSGSTAEIVFNLIKAPPGPYRKLVVAAKEGSLILDCSNGSDTNAECFVGIFPGMDPAKLIAPNDPLSIFVRADSIKFDDENGASFSGQARDQVLELLSLKDNHWNGIAISAPEGHVSLRCPLTANYCNFLTLRTL